MRFNKMIAAFKKLFRKDKTEDRLSENLQATIIMNTLSYNNSVAIVDENGESHTPRIPDSVEEEILVKKGDQVNDFEVIELSSHFIELRSYTEYMSDNASTPRTQFIIEKGESINLQMCGVYDAVHKISIKYI